MLPRADGFLYCITLQFGSYIICLVDMSYSMFQIIGLGWVLADPKLLDSEASKSDVLWIGQDSIHSVYVYFSLAVVTMVMSVIGSMGVKSSNLEQIQAYLYWKMVAIIALVLLQSFQVHRATA